MLIDGSAIDMATVGVAVVSLFFRPIRRKLRRKTRAMNCLRLGGGGYAVRREAD